MSFQSELTGLEASSDGVEVSLSHSGCPPWTCFVGENYKEAATHWIQEANIDGMDDRGWVSLIYSTRYGAAEIVELLIEKGVDINQPDDDGWTPLLHSIVGGNTKISKLLIDKGAQVNFFNNKGETALMFCAKYDAIETAVLLIENGADVNQANCDGWTALTYCARYGNSPGIAELLIYEWADVNQSDLL